MMECDKNALFVVVVVCGCLCGSSLGKDARTERVTFENGSLKLLGDLLIPSGSGPHPAVVIVHGSGGSDRNGPGGYYRLTAEHFQAHGFVVLTFDKRGVGDSAGEWRTASFETLASDAAAGFKFLRLRPEVDTQKVGLWGISQAGWVMPLVANAVDKAAFIVVVSGAGTGTTPGEQNLYDIGNQARALGLSDRNTKVVLTAWRELYTSVRLDQYADHRALDQVVTDARNASIPGQLIPPSSKRIRWKTRDQWFLALDVDYDAIPDWKQVRCPILAIYGSADQSTPVDLVAKRFRKEVMNLARNDEVVIIDGGSHTLLQGPIGATAFSDAYLASMDSWLSRILRGQR